MRLRIGISHPGDKTKVTGFVLGKASANEQRLIDDCIDEASRSIDTLMAEGWGTALQRLHSYRPEQKG